MSVHFIELENVDVFYTVKGKVEEVVHAWHGSRAGQVEVQGRHVLIKALREFNVRLEQGDRVGLLGGNGAGKTTLLKVMAGIIPPTSGRVRIHGRISPLLSITLGLDNEATGLENIVIRGKILGIPGGLMQDQVEEIAEFSELGEYLGLPLKTYSSGMRLRLAFGIATAFDPEILIMDEWLSAGDEPFKKKAKKRLESMIFNSGVFVFASHNRSLHKEFCTKGLVLDRGHCEFLGPIGEALAFLDERNAARLR